MSRRFNYTGRKKLQRECFQIKLQERAGSPPSFSAHVSIPAELKLAPSARIYIEAYVGNSSMRFDFGTVSSVIHPHDCVLTELDANTPILFRVRIVDESEAVGRILASANGIRPEADRDGANRKSILPLRGMDLGEELWRLVLDRDAGPTLAVNNRIPGLVERIPSDALLMAVLFPEVVRQVVKQIWGVENDFDESIEWVTDWKSWLASHHGGALHEAVNDEEALEKLADDVVRVFADRHKFASKVAQSVGELW